MILTSTTCPTNKGFWQSLPYIFGFLQYTLVSFGYELLFLFCPSSAVNLFYLLLALLTKYFLWSWYFFVIADRTYLYWNTLFAPESAFEKLVFTFYSIKQWINGENISSNSRNDFFFLSQGSSELASSLGSHCCYLKIIFALKPFTFRMIPERSI